MKAKGIQFVLLAGLLLLGLAGVAWGQDSLNVTQLALLTFYGESAEQIAVHGSYGYVTGEEGYSNVLTIINLVNPSAPLVIGQCDSLSEVYDLEVEDNFAFTAAGYYGLEIIDVSNPYSPEVIEAWEFLYFFPNALDVNGDFLYLAGVASTGVGSSNLYILDISDPSTPIEMGSCFVGSDRYLWDITVANGFAYVPIEETGFSIVDISNPAAPALVGTWESPAGAASDLAVSGNFVYLACAGAGLRVVDISNSTTPVEVGYWDPLGIGDVEGVTISGNYAYLAVEEEGDMRVLNISNPSQPEEVGYYLTPGMIQDIAVQGDYAYVADYYYFGVYDCSACTTASRVNPYGETTNNHPSTFTLHPPHPNPFNPSTVLSFELRVPSYVKLEVFDINGERVGTGLAPVQQYSAGTHQITFDGSDLPSGIYLAKLTAGELISVQKLVLLK